MVDWQYNVAFMTDNNRKVLFFYNSLIIKVSLFLKSGRPGPDPIKNSLRLLRSRPDRVGEDTVQADLPRRDVVCLAR